jgi:hypothetical protein
MQTTNLDPKLTSFLNAAVGGIYFDERTPEKVARATMIAARAYVHGTCLMHESTKLHNEELVARNARCELCGGIVDARDGATHSLCVARARRGVHRQAPLPKIHSFQICSCTPCSKGRPSFVGQGYTEQFTDLIATLGDAAEVAR